MIPQISVAYKKGLFLPHTACPLIISATANDAVAEQATPGVSGINGLSKSCLY